jgi:NAD(P)-dependent dehydrogenase (short-subunit alcohol dehydrogenase family)
MTEGLFDLTGKTALVTGASVGIGRMLAQGLADAGARVCIVSRSAGDCAKTVAEIEASGGVAFTIPADLSDPAEITRLASEFAEREPCLHILVNNAGRMIQAPIEEFPIEAWNAVMDLDLRAPFLVTQALIRSLEAAASMEDPARVVNIGSVDGIKPPFLDTFPYPAAKAALHHLTKHLALVLGPRGISVNAIAPGAFPSRTADPVLDIHLEDFIDKTPLARIGRPDDMAGTIVYMTSRAGSFLNGAVVVLDGGLTV